MDILGSIGKLYTFLLLVILFLGSGLAVWAGMNAILNKKASIKENTNKIKEDFNTKLQSITYKMNRQAASLVENNNIIGGMNMKNNSFIKLAVFSFIGIIISAAILTALPKYSNSPSNMIMNSGYNTTAMNMQSNMYNQSNMQGMSGYSTQGTMSSSDLYSIQQQLTYMQQQIYQLQNQMNNSMNSSGSNSMNNSSSSMNSGTTNSGSSNSGSSSSMSSMPMM